MSGKIKDEILMNSDRVFYADLEYVIIFVYWILKFWDMGVLRGKIVGKNQNWDFDVSDRVFYADSEYVIIFVCWILKFWDMGVWRSKIDGKIKIEISMVSDRVFYADSEYVIIMHYKAFHIMQDRRID